MPRKRKDEEQEVYHVEVITKARVSEDGDWAIQEYLVKWAGYDSDADSWEPSANVRQCERLLASFWKHVGMDNDNYPVGYETAAREDWIDKEKRYFAETFVKSSKHKANRTTNKDRQERRKLRSSVSPISESSADESESSDEVPSAETQMLNRKARIVDTESESDGDLYGQTKIASHSKTTTRPLKEISKVKQPESLLATGGSSNVAAKPAAVRTHQDQRTNPRVKPMNLSSQSVEAGSSLSTKQRVAAGIPPPPTGPKPLPPIPKKSLPPLSFKKNKTLLLPNTQATDTAMLNAPIETPISPIEITNDTNTVASPQPMDIDQSVDLFDSMVDNAGQLYESSEIPIPPKSQKEIDVDEFLHTIGIAELQGPLEMSTVHGQSDQPVAELNKTLAVPKIPKKWKWCGDLFINTSESKTELLCAVTIADPSGRSDSSHINLLLSPLDSLRISRLYPIMDLTPVLRACGKSQFFGRLESQEPSDEIIIHGLEHHLTSEGLAAAIPLLLDGTEVAVLLVFPGAHQGLTKFLQVPEHPLDTSLLVVLLPFFVSAMTSTSFAGWRSTEVMAQSLLNSQDVLVPHESTQEAVLYQAMSLLYFPKTLLDFLNSSPTSRAYCIWPLPNQLSLEQDTAVLQCILTSSKAVLAKPEDDVRVVFISSRYLEILHTMPSLVKKRVNSPETQFWTYGYSASMTFERWRFQEIYPLGGIVTFTASALAEDLMGCHQLISQIIEHPLWDCYFIPEVLALSHSLCNQGDLRSSSEICLSPILDLINLGSISVVRMPERGCSDQLTCLSHIFNHSSASGNELLEICFEALRSHPITLEMTDEQLISFTNDEIIKDLSMAQIQPAFMENHRRFVVIRAASENTMPFDYGGLEWSSLPQFSFRDDYFQS